MLTYWVKWEEDGWVLSLGGKRLLGPAGDKDGIMVAACDYARRQVDMDALTIRVMLRNREGGERQVGQFGVKPKGPRLV